ncbi:hypothetical protein BU15DRAFT_46324 [Melanogaster broomeanus]|nr:hypothetical protein BU15DRAFT_46324 [Melanogaster broomeanus]
MILAHKPLPFPMSPLVTHHRHPSAPPAVVVQPTKVPGILSISKQPRTSPPRQHQQQQQLQSQQRHQHRSPKPKHLPPQNRTPQPHQSDAQSQDDTHHNRPTNPRGVDNLNLRKIRARQGESLLLLIAHSRRNNVRQPSPPLHSSQVEGNILPSTQSFAHRNNNPASNSFDPFIASSDSDSDNPHPSMSLMSNEAKAAPALIAQPSGKLARRRNHTTQALTTPTPASRTVPVPRPGKHSAPRNNISRSAPNSYGLSRAGDRRISAGLPAEFPVCDDTTDVEDSSPPSTPTRESTTWRQLPFDGPRTAPLSTNSFSLVGPAGSSPSPARRHYRTPSEGVFNMSFDEDISSASNTSEELQELFGFPPKRFGSVGPSAVRAGKDKAGFFASSLFQNSPSPDELPPPAF